MSHLCIGSIGRLFERMLVLDGYAKLYSRVLKCMYISQILGVASLLSSIRKKKGGFFLISAMKRSLIPNSYDIECFSFRMSHIS